jgi:hypothetical protein
VTRDDRELEEDEEARRILRRAPGQLSVPSFAEVRARAQHRSSWGLVPAAAILVILAFVMGNALGERRAGVASPTGTAASSPGQSSAQPAASLSAKTAVVLASGLTFVREYDGTRLGAIDAPLGLFAVSPDGTRVAYFTGPGFDELWVADVARLERAQRVLSIAPNFAGGLVWSTDGMGLLFSSQSRDRTPGPEGEPVQSSLEGLHLDLRIGDQPTREQFATQTNLSIRPLIWVREPRLVGAVTPLGQKGPGGYMVVSGDRSTFWSLPDANDAVVSWPVASSDGRWVSSVYRSGFRATEIRVWPSDDLARVTVLRDAALGREIAAARWRPGTLELLVEVGGSLEVWTRDGTKRRVADLRGQVSAVRWDGSAVYTEPDRGPAELIEIDTGRRATLPPQLTSPSSVAGTRIAASVRLE